MEKETLQQIADRLKIFPGNAKGEVFHAHIEYIKYKKGKEGLKMVEEKMKELGVPIDLENVNPFEWMSAGLNVLCIVVAKDVFNWTDKDIFEMGEAAPKISLFFKLMTRYFVSIETMIQNIEKYWRKYFDFGSLEAEFYKEKNELIIREKGVKMHPIVCIYHAGYFKEICKFITGAKNITIEQTVCVYEGGEYDEFLIKWQ